MPVEIPRLVIAGAHSGVGKTSTTLALVHALRRKGMAVQTLKVGPDFLDPTYLSIASGRECYNLDGWMMGRDYVKNLFAEASAGADIAVIEGVMGLFDGAGPDTIDGSTAQIAQWLEAPVALVAGAGGISRSFAAIARGYAGFEPGVEVAGMIANNCGSENHARLLAESLASSGAPPLLGWIRKGAFPSLPRRHLGLVTADGETLGREKLDNLAAGLEEGVGLENIMRVARKAPSISPRPVHETEPDSEAKIRLGVARDSAFHFYYPDNLSSMRRRGAEIVEFSPLDDEAVPCGLDALYIGGGYPEAYARELSENGKTLESVREFSRSGRPVYAECGGLIYLSQGVEDLEGKRYGFAGIIPSWTRMNQRFSALGYVEAELARDSLFGGRGTMLRGHRFHYSELLDDPADSPEWNAAYNLKRKRDGQVIREGYQRGRTLASYAHLHMASRPETLDKFVSYCMEARTQ